MTIQKIGDVLPGLIDRIKSETRTDCHLLQDRWAGLIGETLSKWARPVWISKGELLIEVDSNTVMDVLRHRKASLIKEVNVLLGDDRVQSIRFRLGG